MQDTTEKPDADADRLNGLRVLVAEDRALIAAKIAQVLREAACVVVGPVGTVAAGLDIARRNEPPLDAAVLDIDLHGEPVFPLAEALRARGVPFMFLTGYGPLVIPAPWRDEVRLEKPFHRFTLLPALGSALSRDEAPPSAPARPRPGNPSKAVQRAWEAIRLSRNLITESQMLQGRYLQGWKR
jgi:DNA-binding response OmpR family regulator